MKKSHRILSMLLALATVLSVAIFPSSAEIDPSYFTAENGAIIFDSAEKVAKYIRTDFETAGVKLSFDEEEQALKVEVTGNDPHFYIDWYTNVNRKYNCSSIDYVYTVYKAPLTNSATARSASTELYFCSNAFLNADHRTQKKYTAVPAHGYTTARIDIGGLKAYNYMSGSFRGIRYDVFDKAQVGDVMYIDSVFITLPNKPTVEMSNARAAAQNGYPVDPSTDMLCTTYDVNKYTSPYWKGNYVYNEAVSPIQNDDGSYTYTLMYEPDEIVAVYDGAFNLYYEEGVDFTVSGNKLTILPEGRISTFLLEDIRNWNYEGDRVFFNAFLNVSYTHSDTWDYYIPENKSDKLHNTSEAIINNENYNVVFFGDSITGGANSSSYRGYYPNAPFWWQQIEDALRENYGHTNLNVSDVCEGGSSASGMIDKFKNLVLPKNPDLIFIEFGVNDAQNEAVSSNPSTSKLKLEYKAALNQMINLAKNQNPDCEIVLVAPFYSNIYNYDTIYFDVCRDACLELEEEYSNVVAVNLTDLNGTLFNVKRHYDLTGDNVCHPNDFMSRIYAQACLETIIPAELGYEAYTPKGLGAPQITEITPESASIEITGSATFTATISGGADITYFWNTSALPAGFTVEGADTTALTVTVDKAIADSFTADITLTVTDAKGNVAEKSVTLSYSGVTFGDINNDTKVNSVDLFMMKLMIKQIKTASDYENAAADVNGDGKVNTVDMFELKFRILKGYWK